MAEDSILEKYQKERTKETLRRQQHDISLFQNFLHEKGIEAKNMASSLNPWKNISSKILQEYIQWQLEKGYALQSITIHLATVKVYCRLACKAEILDLETLKQIEKIKGFQKGSSNFVGHRKITRIGLKKETAANLTDKDVDRLKNQPDTVQGHRDSLIICLLLDQGLKRTELANLRREDVDLANGKITTYKSRKKEANIIDLSKDTLNALEKYLEYSPSSELLLHSIHKSGKMREGMSGRSINERVGDLGKKIGLPSLSLEDCHHYWTTHIKVDQKANFPENNQPNQSFHFE
ncbi:tyrosine-type recombinase/integrase [Dictyobacter kobayashii]|uniref:Tyr recombinase domain-containing protein n=1 Tax=Dictyobacter kobayashii TaxID=2014872 RepID=A0A402AHH7_9CHLR|nr:site-specific integrase [Dictyobacter kobayashii]GCE18571.1 hypothetical protein KDK_23710 [Dictyobacter kobayashii]